VVEVRDPASGRQGRVEPIRAGAARELVRAAGHDDVVVAEATVHRATEVLDADLVDAVVRPPAEAAARARRSAGSCERRAEIVDHDTARRHPHRDPVRLPGRRPHDQPARVHVAGAGVAATDAGVANTTSAATARRKDRMFAQNPRRPGKLRLMHDLACVVHLHSTHSDGTGTVPEIARAAARAKADVVLLTDHDTLEAKRRGEEGWYGDVLLLVGEEVSPLGRDHYLAFGLDEHIRHRGLDACGIARAVRDAGGFGFAAHPFSEGSVRFKRPGMPFGGLACDALHGIELWSFANDTGERIAGIPSLLRFLAAPGRVLDHPPERNMRRWDELCRERRVVAIGGLDAHQFGKRIGPVVPVRVMAYHRSFRFIRTHVLCSEPPAGELAPDRELVFDALREGRCYIAVDSVAPASGFRFEADDVEMGGEARAGRRTLRVRAPLAARLRLLRDGREIASTEGTSLDADVDEPGVYRAEAFRHAKGRERTWILSNPVYLR
jgi:hypothetical protein